MQEKSDTMEIEQLHGHSCICFHSCICICFICFICFLFLKSLMGSDHRCMPCFVLSNGQINCAPTSVALARVRADQSRTSSMASNFAWQVLVALEPQAILHHFSICIHPDVCNMAQPGLPSIHSVPWAVGSAILLPICFSIFCLSRTAFQPLYASTTVVFPWP